MRQMARFNLSASKCSRLFPPQHFNSSEGDGVVFWRRFQVGATSIMFLVVRDQCSCPWTSFLTHLWRALAAGNSRARRSPPKVLLAHPCGFGLLPQNEFGSLSQKLSSSAWERPPCFFGCPGRAGLTKGYLLCSRITSISSDFSVPIPSSGNSKTALS